MAIQVKKWKLKNNIQSPVVQQVRGSLGAHEQGLIITSSDFSDGAIKEAAQPDKTPIALMNGEQLVMLLMEHGIGIKCSTQSFRD
jgi:restriction system protein